MAGAREARERARGSELPTAPYPVGEPRRVELSALDWLVFDWTGSRYRVALYTLPEKGLPEDAARRVVGEGTTLETALYRAFGQADVGHDPRFVELYMRATSWGGRLP